ncbi:MAG: FadR family transcriptional regulator, partial [Chloroflexota bacterium]|nr:FadR family transcriptional regulator [Chloroflexota bacterium]
MITNIVRSQSRGGRGQLRQPPLAELVAQNLRRQIVEGILADGDLLPRQEDLLEQFGVSKPSLREALRILETEGLITVQRGNVGGARVHAPRIQDAAYMIGLVLRSRNVSLEDVGDSLKLLEPVCAGLCAARADRSETVLPGLGEAQAQVRQQIDDAAAFTAQAQRFHRTLVALCGSETLIIVVGALESLWLARQEAWAEQAIGSRDFPARPVRETGV